MTARTSGALVVFAKAPRAGLVKTRLTPFLTAVEAAELACAALSSTLATVAQTPIARKVVVLDGPTGSWLPEGVEVIRQRGEGLTDRLANAVHDVGGPLLLIGMDTPQVRTDQLTSAWRTLHRSNVDAVLGPALDGGWWALGLRVAGDVFSGVPMSTADTGRAQLQRLSDLGLRTCVLPVLRDLDTIDDLDALAIMAAPHGAFGRAAVRLLAQAQLRVATRDGSTDVPPQLAKGHVIEL